MPTPLSPRLESTDAGGIPVPCRRAGFTGPHRVAWLGVALAACLGAASAFAQQAPAAATSACDALRAEIEKSSDPLQRMQAAAASTCSKDPAVLAALGGLMNQQLRYADAASYLELALMLDASNLNAQLNYAIALAGSGDLASAEAMLDAVLANPGLPVTLRQAVTRQKATLASRFAPSEWQSRVALGLRLGFDSNLLGSPNLSSLTLTQGGQSQVFLLDESYLSKPGGYLRADVQLDVRRQDADGVRWDLLASLRSRYSPVSGAAGSTQLDLAAERSHYQPVADSGQAAAARQPIASQGTYWGVSISELTAQAGARYSAVGLAAGWGRNWGGSLPGQAQGGAGAGTPSASCMARGGVEYQDRSYLNNQLLSGRYTGVTAAWSCSQPGGLIWLAGLKAGRDLAQDSLRPGGDQTQLNLRLAAYMAVADLAGPSSALPSALRQGNLLADADFGHFTDSRSYNDLIDSGRLRNTNRAAARVEYQYPVSKSTQWAVGAEWVSQRSSLDLFRQQGWGSYAAWRTAW